MKTQKIVGFSPITLLLMGVLLTVFGATVCADPPQTISIRGQLLNAQGQGLGGVREYSVQFYDAATGGTALGTAFTGTTEVSPEGLFNILVLLPEAALTAGEVWYELAVDGGATPGPLGSEDVFPNRVKVESVPFALESAAAAHVAVSAVGSGTVLEGEFEALSGVTSGIQGQLDDKANAADVYTKTEMDTSQGAQDTIIADKANSADVVAKAGDTMTGPLEMTPSAAPVTVTDKLYNVGGSLQWNGNPAYRFPWTTVTADTQLVSNNGYMTNAASQLNLTLPLSSAINVGDTVRVSSIGTGGWKIFQNDLQSIIVGVLQVPGSSAWTAHGPQDSWLAVASSSDGTTLAACTSGSDSIYSSIDSGETWTPHGPNESWQDIASSADGTKLVAVCEFVYTSIDSGITWTQQGWDFRSWTSVASSADGTKLVACAYNDYIYTSTDSGVSWTARDSIREWRSVASSADGLKLVACAGGWPTRNIYTSTDSGVTWTLQGPSLLWQKLASSADGTKLVAAAGNGGQIHISTDSGVTWTPHGTNENWEAVASSADGTKLAACDSDGYIYTSEDSGTTWTLHEDTYALHWLWSDVASSSDGSKLVACGAWGYGSQIYTYKKSTEMMTTTTPGNAGYLSGGAYSAVELQYAGNDTFVPISYVGTLGAN